MWLLGRCASVLLGLCATVALWQVVAHCTVIELVMSGLTRKKKENLLFCAATCGTFIE